MRIAFIRHGPTPWNESGRIQGQTDVSLSEAGRAQIAEWQLPRDLHPCHWFVSPLQRARETAQLLGCTDFSVEQRLIEMGWGEWEGATLAALRARFGSEMRANEQRGLDFRPPGGESPREVQQRVLEWCAELADTDGAAVAVTHKGVIRAIYASAAGWDMQASPPHDLSWQCAHVFRVHRDGQVSLDAVNVALAR